MKIQEEKEDDIVLFTPQKCNEMYEDELLWLKNELNRAKHDGKRVIILTHHSPTDFQCILEEEKTPEQIYFLNFSPLEYLFADPVILWYECIHPKYSYSNVISSR